MRPQGDGTNDPVTKLSSKFFRVRPQCVVELSGVEMRVVEVLFFACADHWDLNSAGEARLEVDAGPGALTGSLPSN